MPAGAALAAWLGFTCVIPARLAGWPRARPAITQVNGTWYLWAVGTQSLAIAAAFLSADGLAGRGGHPCTTRTVGAVPTAGAHTPAGGHHGLSERSPK